MYVLTSNNGIEEQKFNGLLDAIDRAWALADERPGLYRILDDHRSSFVCAAKVRASFDLKDIDVAPEYWEHYKAQRAFRRNPA